MHKENHTPHTLKHIQLLFDSVEYLSFSRLVFIILDELIFIVFSTLPKPVISSTTLGTILNQKGNLILWNVLGLPCGYLPAGASAKLPRKMFKDAECWCWCWTPLPPPLQTESFRCTMRTSNSMLSSFCATKTEPLLQHHCWCLNHRMPVMFWEVCLLAEPSVLLHDIGIASTSFQILCWFIT